MNYELYYLEKKDGSFGLHFPNNHALSEDEVRSRFSVYGNVVTINTRGQDTGLWFVHYETLEGVKRCVQGMQNDKKIKLLPQKSKLHLKDNPPLQKKGNLSNHSSQQSLQSVRQSKSNKKGKIKNSQGKLLDNRQQDLDRPNDNEISMKSSEMSSTNSNANITLDNDIWHKIQNLRSANRRSTVVDAPSETEMGTQSSSEISLTTSNVSIAFENDLRRRLQDLQSLNIKKESRNSIKRQDEADIPGLMTVDTGKLSMSTPNNTMSVKSNVAPGHEIIVANIPSKFSVHYILHLLEKHNPMAVSLMKNTSKNALRYCHVYFKTRQDARATQKEFDYHNLCGQSLIVLSPKKLIEEALFA